MKIQDIHAREIFDSRGIPTVECDLLLNDGTIFTASVPSGTSRSAYEAVELRDGGERLNGLGVQKAVAVIENIIAPIFIDRSPDLILFDTEMIELDQTINKSYLGANAILAVSMALCRAQAYSENMELYEFIAQLCEYSSIDFPSPMFNIFGGGLHNDTQFPIQEILLVPTKKSSFHQAMETGIEIFYVLKDMLQKQGKSTAIGLEGGFIADFTDAYQAFDMVTEAILRTKNDDMKIGLDIAASCFYHDAMQSYTLFGQKMSSQELIEWYCKLADTYPLHSIEDGLAQSDYDGWSGLTKALSGKVCIIGDDLFATDYNRIIQGIKSNAATAAIIKPNQVGTITETLQSVVLCKEHTIDVIVSHRSGETNDSFITDLAIGISAQYIKAGGFNRGERMAKYNRLLNIEQDLSLFL